MGLSTQDTRALASSTAQEQREKTSDTIRQVIQEALLPYLSTRLILVLVGLLTDFYILPLMKGNGILPAVAANTHFPQALWLMWVRFDSGFYTGIAMGGYWPASTLHTYSDWAFFPLFPLLILPLGHLFGGSTTAFDLAGLLVSNIAGLLAVSYLYLLVRRDFGIPAASRTILFLAVFPTSFYLSAVYTESLFLACSVACIYYLRTRRWWLAGLCGGLASLTRSQGILLLMPAVWEYWQWLSDQYAPIKEESSTAPLQERIYLWLLSRLQGPLLAARKIRHWLFLLSFALIPAGLLAFMIYAKIKTGSFLATFHNLQWGWGRYLEAPWQLLSYSLAHPEKANPMDWNFWPLNIIMAFLFLAFTIWAFRKLPVTYSLYTLAMVLLPLSSSRLNSIARYYVLVFPVFILLALWSENTKQPLRKNFILLLSASLLIAFFIFFVLGLPAIA